MQHLYRLFDDLQKQQATEDEQLPEEHRRTTTSRLHEMRVRLERYEEQSAAQASLVQACKVKRERILAILDRLRDLRNTGAELCSSSCP